VLTIQDHQFFSIGSDPISDELPCGENARYEAEFEQLEAELAKQESLTSATVDWGKVIQFSSGLIKTRSKDILVGSYLCYGLLLKEGYTGLAVGLKILNDMAEQHWDCLFPPAKRMRARQTAYVWLAEKAAIIVTEKGPQPGEYQAVIDAADLLKQLDNALVDKMGDQAPLLTELSRPLKNHRQMAQAELEKSAKPAAAAEPEAVAAPAQQAEGQAQPAAPAPSPPPAPTTAARSAPSSASSSASAPSISEGSLDSENDSKKVLRQIQTASRDVAGFWASQKLSDPRAYRLSRVAAWMVVENAPPANEGVTQVLPPAAERLKFFETKIEKSEFSAVLGELEKTIARSPFWLDGHFMVVKVLRSLGVEYEPAVQTVIRETAHFLNRLPELIDLSFSDNTPFASDQTRLWLNAEVLGSAASANDKGSEEGDSGEPWAEGLKEAGRKAAAGSTEEAVEVMRNGLLQAAQMRDKMYWRCALAQLLLQIGDAASASGILEQLSAQLDEDHLLHWEPKLLAYTYNLLFQSYQKQQKKNKDDKVLTEKASRAYEKLCWFDPITALSMKGG